MSIPSIGGILPGNSGGAGGGGFEQALQTASQASKAMDKMMPSMIGNLFQQSMQLLKPLMDEPVQEGKDDGE